MVEGQYCGIYGEIAESINQVHVQLKGIVEVANVIAEGKLDCLDELKQYGKQSETDTLVPRMIGNYAGDHAEIKEALNITTAFLKRYVDEITHTLEEIGRGNLNQEITAEYQGDFAQIKNAFNDITAHLSTTMTEINVAAEQVEVAARQVSDSGQALAQGATEQASAIEELNASIEEVAGETKDNAVRANQANAITVTVEERAKGSVK